jgi:hypothetical protein
MTIFVPSFFNALNCGGVQMGEKMLIQKIGLSEINPAKYNPRKDLKPGDPELKS